jgi:gluconokinase
MAHVPGLRSCYAKVGRLVYFGRMLDKIRLHAAGRLPAEYTGNLGDEKQNVFDGRCCRFLGVQYAALRERTLAGGTDEEILTWAHTQGTPRTDEECHIWNRFLTKLGWRDERSHVLPERIRASGLEGKTIETIVDHIEYDEGRDPVASRAWEAV